MKLGCVVMAAGESRRFGTENKLLQNFCGVPLYVRALDAVPGGVFDTVRVVTAWEPVVSLAAQRGFLVVSNDRPELGISRTIRLGLEFLTDCDGVLFMTADQPLLTAQTVRRLAAVFEKNPACIVAVAHNDKRGNPCIFPQELYSELLSLEGDIGGSRIIKSHSDRLLMVEVPEQELADCDTARSLLELERKYEETADNG